MSFTKLLFISSAIFLLTSCSKSAKHTYGLTENMPDEFQVQKAKPLEVPPHFNHSNPIPPKDKKLLNSKKLSPAEEAALKEATE